MNTEPTTDLEQVQPANGVLSERMRYAQVLASADLLPAAYRRKPANVLLAIEYAHSVDIAVTTAIQEVHVIDGKPSASAKLIGGLVRRAGHRLRVTFDGRRAVAEIVRRDDPEFTFRSEWTMERANAANLTGKQVWKQYPDAMLKARAITECARDACPEALAGIAYTPEELGADVFDTTANTSSDPWNTAAPAAPPAAPREAETTEPGDDIEDGEVVDETPAAPPVEQASKAQLAAIGAMLGKCGVTDRTERAQVIGLIVGVGMGEPVKHTTDLTKPEASKVFDTLKPLADSGNPMQAFAGWFASL